MNKQDLKQEQAHIDQRRAALSGQLNDHAFVQTLPQEQHLLLRRELDILNNYSQVLTERQQNFFDPQPGQKEGIAIPPDQNARQNLQPGQRYNEATGTIDTNHTTAAPTPQAPAEVPKAKAERTQEQPTPQVKVQQQQKQAPKKKATTQKASPKLASKAKK